MFQNSFTVKMRPLNEENTHIGKMTVKIKSTGMELLDREWTHHAVKKPEKSRF